MTHAPLAPLTTRIEEFEGEAYFVFPDAMMKHLGLEIGDPIDIQVEPGSLTIRAIEAHAED